MTVEVGLTLTVVAGDSCRMKIDGIQRASSVKSGQFLYQKYFSKNGTDLHEAVLTYVFRSLLFSL